MNTKPTLLGPLDCADLCPKRRSNREWSDGKIQLSMSVH